MNKSKDNVLLIFIKNPERGKVKTRLAQTIGEKKALQVYRRLLAITKNVTDQLQCTRQLWYSNYIENEDQWDDAYEKKLQVGNDLGERMRHAFDQSFSEGADNVVIIGSDCPELSPTLIERAFRILQTQEVVIGPSRDGGYYLLGMNNFHPGLFENKQWSTSTVYEETIAEIREAELTFEVLPQLNDIDTEEDLIDSGKRLQQ